MRFACIKRVFRRDPYTNNELLPAWHNPSKTMDCYYTSTHTVIHYIRADDIIWEDYFFDFPGERIKNMMFYPKPVNDDKMDKIESMFKGADAIAENFIKEMER